MRREIKFRAWDKTNKRMLSQDEMTGIGNFYYNYGVSPEVDEYALMQYTGLKDNNGKEIYEGDIVKHKDQFGNIAIGKVVWKAPEFLLDFEKQNRWSAEEEDTGVEVMGNIYENPDLFEKSSD